ncbi:hypothetical protein SCP_0203220 [Sparassis crispa]|uniref:Uncharacterized protein n=1 Tax=Sparassis crispa TaxID=139825 RepID=A0A401GAD0_9APHY|nr:hypothetical protein SCP_0203220 [Sparassis crispa]GBE79125.1 hypothetical protein SCP_0203220 [Sparassis crispa]
MIDLKKVTATYSYTLGGDGPYNQHPYSAHLEVPNNLMNIATTYLPTVVHTVSCILDGITPCGTLHEVPAIPIEKKEGTDRPLS